MLASGLVQLCFFHIRLTCFSLPRNLVPGLSSSHFQGVSPDLMPGLFCS